MRFRTAPALAALALLAGITCLAPPRARAADSLPAASFSSPWLRESTANPIAWRAFGQAPFDEARRRQCLVFMDISPGWSEWARRMVAESYADPAIAETIHRSFVAIKVDSDERPDLEARYQRLAGRVNSAAIGGAPLLLFLTPDGDVFFATNYLPRSSADGRGFAPLLDSVAKLWDERDPTALREIHAPTRELAAIPGRVLDPAATLSPGLSRRVHDAVLRARSPLYPGFGPPEGPRFPAPAPLRLLLDLSAATADERSLRAVRDTLLAMSQGAIQDPLDGGLHRGTTDGRWLRPRFEKRLLDQALHIDLLARAQQLTPSLRQGSDLAALIHFLRTSFALRGGGFAASMAPTAPGLTSEATYTFHAEEIRAEFPPELARLALLRYGFDDALRITPTPTPAPGAASTTVPLPKDSPALRRQPLASPRTLEKLAESFLRIPPPELARMCETLRKRMLELRRARAPVPPPIDTRFFPGLNARVASALLAAADPAGDPTLLLDAEHIETRIRREGFSPDRWILHVAAEDALAAAPPPAASAPPARSTGPILLEDQVAWISLQLTRAELFGDTAALDTAAQHATRTLAAFARPREAGGGALDRLAFVDDPTTSPIRVDLVLYEDGTGPGPVSELALALARLGWATGDPQFHRAAADLLRPGARVVETVPSRVWSTWTAALLLLSRGAVARIDAPDTPTLRQWIHGSGATRRPFLVVRGQLRPGAPPSARILSRPAPPSAQAELSFATPLDSSAELTSLEAFAAALGTFAWPSTIPIAQLPPAPTPAPTPTPGVVLPIR